MTSTPPHTLTPPTFVTPPTPPASVAMASGCYQPQIQQWLFPKASMGGVSLPMMDSLGRIRLLGMNEGLSPETYIALLHLYVSILEADRMVASVHEHLALTPKLIANDAHHAVTRLDASKHTPNLYYKREDQTAIKAYKARGAYCGMKHAMDASHMSDFIAVSTGNHAQGILRAAELLQPKRVRIVVPTNTSKTKLEKINYRIDTARSCGVDASVLFKGDTFDEARRWAVQQQSQGGGYYLDPYSNPFVVAGQGTIGLELFRQLRPILEANPCIEEIVIISPIGGGGLLAGTATALRMAAAWDALFQRVELKFVGLRLTDMATTYGDAVRVKEVAEGNRYIFDMLDITRLKMNDDHMAWGMKHVLDDLGDRVEGPSGATAYFALNQIELMPNEHRLVVGILSGGNVGAFPQANAFDW